MRCTKRFFCFLFLYVITLAETGVVTDRLTELEEAAKKSNIKSLWLNKNASIVFIGSMSYEIYFFEDNGVQYIKNYFHNTLAKFYTCLNCIVAEWTQDQLFKLIVPTPLLYQKIFVYKYNDQFLKHFKKSHALVNQVVDISEKIINILMTFLNIYLSANDTSNDTFILRTLLSLNFKINFIKTHYNEQNTKYENNDPALPRMMLGMLNSIQNFIFLNCQLSSYHGNKEFFEIIENKFKEQNIMKLFLDINSLNLETQKRCNINQMILVDQITRRFGQIKWKIQDGFVTIQHIMQTIQQWHDLEIIQWYQIFIFNTITKLLITKALNYYMQHKNFAKVIINDFETIHSSVIREIDHLPTKTIECFSLLLIKKKKISFLNKLKFKFVPYIKDEDWYYMEDGLEECMTSCLKLFDSIELEIDSNSIPTSEGFGNVSEHLNKLPISTLEEFINYLKEIKNDLKCFIRLFEFLHNENNTYNVPLAQKMEKIRLFEQDLFKSVIWIDEPTKQIPLEEKKQGNQDFLNCEGCYYFRGLYHYCLDTIIHLNMANDEDQDEGTKTKYKLQANSNLNDVKKLSLELVQHYSYLPHFKVVYNITPLVELMIEFNFSAEYSDKKRLILVIMTELNNYDIEFCNPPEFNFLFLYSINFNMIGLISTQVNNQIKTSIEALKNSVVASDHEYSRIRDLFKTFFSSYSGVLYRYRHITLKWKGRNQTIGDIYNSFVFAMLGPSNLYSTYNFYFKFSLSILYYEVYNAYNVVPNLSNLTERHQFFVSLRENQFPTIFREIIININNFDSYFTSNEYSKDERDKVKEKMNNQLKKIGISIDFTESDKKKNENKRYKSKEAIDLFLEETFSTAMCNVKGVINFIDKVVENFESNYIYGEKYKEDNV